MPDKQITSGSIHDITLVIDGMIGAKPANLVEAWGSRSRLVRQLEIDGKQGTLPVSVSLATGLRLNGMAQMDELVMDAIGGQPNDLIERLARLKAASSGGEADIERTISELRAIQSK